MANHTAKFPERLLLAISAKQKARLYAVAERDHTSAAAVVRRALNRELAA